MLNQKQKDVLKHKNDELLKELSLNKMLVENRYKNIFSNTPVGTIRFNANGIIEESNEAFQNMLGSSGEKLYLLDLKTLPDSGIHDSVMKCLEGYSSSYEGWYKSITGNKTIYVTAKFIPFMDNQVVTGGLGVINDVTAIKLSEKLMEDQKISFEALFKNSPNAIVQFNEQHQAIKINDAFATLFGYSQLEVVGKEIDALLSNFETLAEMKNYTSKLFEGESVRAFGIRTGKNGEKIDVDIVGIPIIIENKVVGGYTIYTDVREERIIKQELMISKEEADSANRAKSKFLANMSHEIRTPMNGFIGVLKLFEDTPLNIEQKKYLQLAENSAKSLLKLVSDILEYSKIESSQLKLEVSPFDMLHLLDETISLYRPLAYQKNLSMRWAMDPDIKHMWEGDAFRIKQVLSNLISNAIKYTDKGDIDVNVKLLDKDSEERHMIKFEVCDTGIGIPDEKKELLFKRFSQVHENNEKFYGGTGLGLAISKGIVDLMNGDLKMESSSSRGSCFSFTCRLKGYDLATKVVCVTESNLKIKNGFKIKKILIADDDEVSRFVIEKLSKAKGWEVVIAENGQMAFELCEIIVFDVILMDCQMPILSGIEATMKIRSESTLNAQTPIFALTAFSKKEDEEKCIEAGMNYYFSKPIDFDLLFNKIKSIQ